MKKTVTPTNDETDSETEKKCFVICPIGEPESETRKRSDKILKHIIRPVVEDLGYKPLRSDDISAPGVITSQIIEHLIEDELVIADLTDGNSNVYYELAVRHISKKPIVQMIHTGQKPSFDVTVQRTIPFDYKDLDSVEKCKEQLKAQIITVEKDPKKVDSPISQAIDIFALSKSGEPMEKWMAQVMRMLERITSEVCEDRQSEGSFYVSTDVPSSVQRPTLFSGHPIILRGPMIGAEIQSKSEQ